ncbi:HET-domain-containing protein [Canariomyces notabilis]|uniref:HET-domain-containing protein n=1 Tax=Canariomyces notabilis TaxID=2074819 RepID=A0AAN6TD56_9PEZI|nr:HET-domain-containing protein [Canariomyces arenarius]
MQIPRLEFCLVAIVLGSDWTSGRWAGRLPYAILSHTWEDEEVSFQEFANLDKAKEKAGYAKIDQTCRIAKSQGLQYAWVDTCCIDKTSSAELTEAINSMFQWYRQSDVCYAYIADLPPCQQTDTVAAKLDWLSTSASKSYRWFTRGWTLQELIAPQRLEFYDKDWEYRGDKKGLLAELEQHTGIDAPVLKNSGLLSGWPVARKMSWASSRQTTRVEDMAYCLLGIFNVHMPMIYGEGSRAFIRLQEEISKETNDLSLFAWTAKMPPINMTELTDNLAQPPAKVSMETSPLSLIAVSATDFSGVLAPSPREFSECRDIMRVRNPSNPSLEFTLTNNGVKMKPNIGRTESGEYVLSLECAGTCAVSEDESEPVGLGIYLCKTASGFARIRPWMLFLTDDDRIWAGKRRRVYIHKTLDAEQQQRIALEVEGYMFIQYNAAKPYAIEEIVSSPRALWDPELSRFLTMQAVSSVGTEQPDIYAHFTGFQMFDVSHRGKHLCRCLLVCGIFEDSWSRLRPLAALYEESDPSAKTLFEDIRASRGAEGDTALLNRIRNFVISRRESFDTSEVLESQHVLDRVVETRRAFILLNLSHLPDSEDSKVEVQAAKCKVVVDILPKSRPLLASNS